MCREMIWVWVACVLSGGRRRRRGKGEVDYTSSLKVVNISYVVEVLGEEVGLRECACRMCAGHEGGGRM